MPEELTIDQYSVYRKIFMVQRAIPAIPKDENNSAQGFKYVSSSAVLSKVREAMDEVGLLLLFDTVDCKTEQAAAYKGKQALTTIKVYATWIDADNPASQVTMTWYGMGADDGEKALGKALTYMEKYNLLKNFHIPTDDADPDADATPIDGPACKLCGKPMALRDGKRGPFYGCTGYPNCKGTMQVEDAVEEEEAPVNTASLEELWNQTEAVIKQVRGVGLDDEDTVAAMKRWAEKHGDGIVELEEWTAEMVLKFKASIDKIVK